MPGRERRKKFPALCQIPQFPDRIQPEPQRGFLSVLRGKEISGVIHGKQIHGAGRRSLRFGRETQLPVPDHRMHPAGGIKEKDPVPGPGRAGNIPVVQPARRNILYHPVQGKVQPLGVRRINDCSTAELPGNDIGVRSEIDTTSGLRTFNFHKPLSKTIEAMATVVNQFVTNFC